MKHGEFGQLRELFDRAIDLEGEARRRFLDDHSGTGTELRGVLEDLLERDDAFGSFDETFGWRRHGADIAPRIAGLEVLRLLGQGGMGNVYEAVQAHPVRRVALKVMRPEHATARTIARFVDEADILARLTHPNIAQIHQSGTIPVDGAEHPYLVMELVDGEPLVAYADARPPRERLELFMDLCDAVQHAHARGVVHRDLKPDNILVREDGVLKILDFGVAIATTADVTMATSRTRPGHLVGTVAYMSPEQTRGDRSMVDSRSDVYSLGVILFELLTGRHPQDLHGLPLFDAIKKIREGEPIARASLDGTLGRDALAIVGAALCKDPDERYQSAGELRDDVQRMLGDQPIRARSASVADRTLKFAKRNAVQLAVWSVLAASVVGLGVSVWIGQQRAAGERVAQQNAQQLLATIVRVLEPDDRGHTAGGIDALYLVRNMIGAEALPSADVPRVRYALADAFLHLGRPREALADFDRVLEASSDLELVIAARIGRGMALADKGDLARAEVALTQVAAEAEGQLEPCHGLSIAAKRELASFVSTLGRNDAALGDLRRVLQQAARCLPNEHIEVLRTRAAICRVLADAGRYDVAAEAIDPLLADVVESLGDRHLLWLSVQADRMRVHAAHRLGEQFLDECQRLLSQASETFGSTSPYVVEIRQQYSLSHQAWRESSVADDVGSDLERYHRASHLATEYVDAGRLNEAERMFDEVIAAATGRVGPGHQVLLRSWVGLIRVAELKGRPDHVGKLLNALLTTVRGADMASEGTQRSLFDLCATLLSIGRAREAIELLEEIIDAAAGNAKPIQVCRYRALRLRCLTSLGLLAEAEQGYAELLADNGLPRRNRLRLLALLERADLLRRLGRHDEAIQIHDAFPSRVDDREGMQRLLADSHRGAALCLIDLERYAEALEFLDRARRIFDDIGASARESAELMTVKGRLLVALGRYDDADVAFLNAHVALLGATGVGRDQAAENASTAASRFAEAGQSNRAAAWRERADAQDASIAPRR